MGFAHLSRADQFSFFGNFREIVSIVLGRNRLALVVRDGLRESNSHDVTAALDGHDSGISGIAGRESLDGDGADHTGGAAGNGIDLVCGIGLQILKNDGRGCIGCIFYQSVRYGRILVGIQGVRIQFGCRITLVNDIGIVGSGTRRSNGDRCGIVRYFGYGNLHSGGVHHLVDVRIVLRQRRA